MTNDTLKSLGYLKSSLKKNHRAMVNNVLQDSIDVVEFGVFTGHTKAVLDQIEIWEKAVVSVSIPNGVVQPLPSASVVSTVPFDTDDDLLSNP